MKKLFLKNIIFIGFLEMSLFGTAFAIQNSSSNSDSKLISIGDVAPLMAKKNLKVKQGSIQVFQAKTNIEKARADLLPRLTIWTIAEIFVNSKAFFQPEAIISKITDLAPFLVPANWFRLEENKILFKAEKEGFLAMKNNEIHTAKSLFFRILFDQKLVTHIRNSISELEILHRMIEAQEKFGGVKPGTARDIEIRVLGLKEDLENMNLLIGQELLEFSYILGFKADVAVTLTPIADHDVTNLKPINVLDHEPRMLSLSPERKQFDHFLAALNYVEEEIQWSFFGVSNISRGVAGGIFDAIPITQGFFGSETSMKIASVQRENLKLQKTGVEETLRRQLRNLAAQYNSDLNNFGLYTRRVQLAKESNDALLRRARLGEPIDALEFSENARSRIQVETNRLAVLMRFLTNQDRLERMTFRGDYSVNFSNSSRRR